MSALDQLLGEDFKERVEARTVRDQANEEVKKYRDRDPLPPKKNHYSGGKSSRTYHCCPLSLKDICVYPPPVWHLKGFSALQEILFPQNAVCSNMSTWIS